MNFKINSGPLFTIIFKTRDFSPLIERVLAGVLSFHNDYNLYQLVAVHIELELFCDMNS